MSTRNSGLLSFRFSSTTVKVGSPRASSTNLGRISLSFSKLGAWMIICMGSPARAPTWMVWSWTTLTRAPVTPLALAKAVLAISIWERSRCSGSTRYMRMKPELTPAEAEKPGAVTESSTSASGVPPPTALIILSM